MEDKKKRRRGIPTAMGNAMAFGKKKKRALIRDEGRG